MRFTARRRPVALVWCEEQPNRTLAQKREKEMKGWSREKKLNLRKEYRLGVNPSPAAQGKGE